MVKSKRSKVESQVVDTQEVTVAEAVVEPQNGKEVIEMTKTKRHKSPSISREDFFAAWMHASETGGTVGDVATALGVSVTRVSQKAAQFRANGVDLPTLNRPKRATSFDAFKARLDESIARKSA